MNQKPSTMNAATNPETRAQIRNWIELILWGLLAFLLYRLFWKLWLLRLPEYCFLLWFVVDFYILWMLAVGNAGFALFMLVRRNRGRSFTWSRAIILVGIPIILAGVAIAEYFQWPLRAAFRQSRPGLEQIADELSRQRKTEFVPIKRHVGTYYVNSGMVSGSCILLRIDNAESRHDFYGFFRLPDEQSETVSGKKYGHPEILLTRISGDWFVAYSHYWAIKFGWS